jgi:hypothetical protein
VRALSRSGCSQNQVLKAVPALLALVFVDWHKGSFFLPPQQTGPRPNEGPTTGFIVFPPCFVRNDQFGSRAFEAVIRSHRPIEWASVGPGWNHPEKASYHPEM